MTAVQMEDEFDHRAYQSLHGRYRILKKLLSGRGPAASRSTCEIDVEVCETDSDSDSDSDSDAVSEEKSEVLEPGSPKKRTQLSQRQSCGDYDLREREYKIAKDNPSEKLKKKWDKAYRKKWEYYRLLCGEDKRRLLTNINDTLPNLGLVSSVFVLLIDGSPLELRSKGSGCIISDDGRFVLTAGHMVDTSFDIDRVISALCWKFPGVTDLSRAQREKYIKIVKARAKDGQLFQEKREKALNQHTFYRCHRFRKDGKARCRDIIKAKAFQAHPRYAKAMNEQSGSQWFFQNTFDSFFGDELTVEQRTDRYDFGILELERPPKEMNDLNKVAFGMISHLTGRKEMKQFVIETKVGLWGYSGDKDLDENANKGTLFDHRATFDQAKKKYCDASKVKRITRRCWGHSAQIFYDPKQVDDFNVLLSVTDSWHGVSGAPLWFMNNQQQSELMGDELMYLEPNTRRRIIGGVASSSVRCKYHLTSGYIESVKHKKKLSRKKIQVAVDPASVFDDDAVNWIERVTGQKCHRAKYDVTGKIKWRTGSFYQKK